MKTVTGPRSQVNSFQYRYFPGWNMVAAAFVVNSISVGFFFYSYGVLLKTLSDEFEASRFDIAMGLTLSHVVGSLVAPFLGRAIDKYPLKQVMTLGTLSVGGGFIAISLCESLIQFYLAVGVFVAVGTSAMGMQSSVKLVANWFVAKRGFTMGIATMGTSLAGILMPPITTALLVALGWRGTFVAFAVFSLMVILPFIRWVVIDRPEDLGLLPDGVSVKGSIQNEVEPVAECAVTPSEDVSEASFTTRETVRQFKFWNIVVVFGILHGTLGAVLVHLVAFVTDQGISSYEAAYYLSLSALTGIFSKLIFGWLSDHFDVRVAIFLVIVFMVSGLSVLASTPSHWQLAAAILVFGVGSGGVAPLRSTVISKAYGRRRVASAGGLLRLFTLPFVVCGAPLMGWIYDTYGVYQPGFYLLLASLGVGALVALFIKLEDVDDLSLTVQSPRC